MSNAQHAAVQVSPLAGKLAPFLRRAGAVWTTDKDGLVPALLSAEISARVGRDPGEVYRARGPGIGAAIGGLKVIAEHGWFAARLSGTEDVYKIYAESYRGADLMRRIQDQAQCMVNTAFAATSAPNGPAVRRLDERGKARWRNEGNPR